MIEHGVWAGLKAAISWLMVPLGALLSYVLYRHKKVEQEVKDLSNQVHRLEVSHEISVIEVKEIKQDIKEIKHSLDRIADKLWERK